MPNSLEPAGAAPRVRFPISAKILLWFFLNLAFLGAAAWIFARVQLRFGLDSLLAGPVSDRLQSMGEVLTQQLESMRRWVDHLRRRAGEGIVL